MLVGELVGRWIVDYKMDQDQGKDKDCCGRLAIGDAVVAGDPGFSSAESRDPSYWQLTPETGGHHGDPYPDPLSLSLFLS